MKKKILFTFILLCFILGCKVTYAPNVSPDYVYEDIQAELRERYLCEQEIEFRQNLKRFKADLAFRESGDNWKEYNQYGYIGKFQFGKDALEVTGFGHVNFIDFINNPSVFPEIDQEKAMDSLLTINENLLKPYIENYQGKTLSDSIKVTRSGLLAAAHLAGPNNVIRFLKTGGKHNPSDQMGTKLSDYLTNFAAKFQ